MTTTEQVTITHIKPPGSSDCMEEIRITRIVIPGRPVTLHLERLQHPNRGRDNTFNISLSEDLADEIGRALLKSRKEETA